VLIFFLHIISMMGVAQMPFALAAKGVTSPVLVSIAVSSAGVMMSIGAIVSGHLQSRLGPWPPLCAGVLVAAAGCLTVGAAPNGLITAIGNNLSVLGCGLYFPQYLTLPLSRVAPEERAMAVGVSQSAIYLGAFLNPFLLAPLRELFGIAGTYAAVGTLAAGATAVGIVYTLLRNLGRARARAVPAE
jgi:MFS family permease